MAGRPLTQDSCDNDVMAITALRRAAGVALQLLATVPVMLIFRCEICSVRPDAQTQRALERQVLDLRHGEYVDADPGRWLTWHGREMYGPNCYACGGERDELKACL